MRDDSYPPYTVQLDCQALWQSFSSSFRGKDDRQVGTQDFAPFFARSDVQNSLAGTGRAAMFWSGVQPIVEQFQISCHLFVMETSPIVSILTDLMFCGSSSDPSGFNMTSCVYGDFDSSVGWQGTWVSFWAAASAAYAPTITGNITMLFSGNAARPAYRRTSFFGSIELPRLDPKKITGALIWVAPQAANEPIYEPCGSGSLKLLIDDLTRQGFDPATIQCKNNPRVVRHLQCALQYTIPECQFPSNYTTTQEQDLFVNQNEN